MKRWQTGAGMMLLWAATLVPVVAEEDPTLTVVVGVGVGALVPATPYRATRSSYLTVPLLRFEKPRGGVRGTHLFWELLQSDRYSIGVTGYLDPRYYNPRFARDPQMQQLDKRERLVMVGGHLTTKAPMGEWRLTVAGDVTGATYGAAIKAQYRYPLSLYGDRLSLIPSLGVEWDSKAILRHFYGVSDAESALSGLAVYTPGLTLTPNAELIVSYRLFNQVYLVTQLDGNYLPSALSNSPMVGQSYAFSALIGAVYKFGVAVD